MEILPVKITIERKNLLPILTVTGTTKNVTIAQKTLLNTAINIIDIAEKEFKGKLLELMGHENELRIPNGMVAVRFYILFRTEEEFENAIKNIQKELG